MGKTTLKIKEADVRKSIYKWCKIMGWYYYWNLQGMGSKPGLSDLVLIKNGVVIWVEVKKPGGKQSPRQIDFENEITAYGANYVVACSYKDIEDYIKKL